MNDSQFDDFVNNRLNEYAAPVPAGLWEKVAEGQFDQFIGNKLRDHSAPVPEGVWEKIADRQFDQVIADKLEPAEAPVPAGLWNRIADAQFDAFVAGKLTNYEAPVPAGLWDKVRPQEEDDDRVGFFWFRYPAAAVLIVALLTAGAWGGYFLLSSKEKAATVLSSPPPSPSAVRDPSQNNLSSPSQQNTGAMGAGSDSPSAAATAGTQGTPAERSESNSTLVTPIRKNPVSGGMATAPQNGVGHPSNRLAPPQRKVEITTQAYNLFPPQNSGTASVPPVEAVTGEKGIDIAPYQPGYTEEATVSQTGWQPKDLSDKQLSTHQRKFKSVIICPADKGRNKDWFLETYVSPDLAFKSVQNVSASSLYMLKKDSAERSAIGFSAGIRLVKPITDNFLVKAGVQFTQANEKYTYRTENELKTTTVVTVRTIIRAPGDTVIVQDTSILQTAGYKTNKVNTSIRSIDIPLTVGYQFGNEDLKFGINAGVVFNLTTWYGGMVLDSTLANVPLNKSGNGIYRSNLGVGLTGSISIVKKLSDDLHVFAEPYFRYNLSNMSTVQAGFNQRLHLGGLALGLRFHLNRY